MVYAGGPPASGIWDPFTFISWVLMLAMSSRDEFLFYSERELDMELDVIGQP